MKLTGFDEQEKLLLSQNMRLAETQVLLKQQISKVEENLAQAHTNRPKAINKVSDEAQAMTLLMITNQIEQNDKRLYDLQERLTIEIENEKEILQNNVTQKVAEKSRQTRQSHREEIVAEIGSDQYS